MQIIKTESELEKTRAGAVLTIGNFDGVHTGHQAILSAAKRIAAQKQTELVVMTFQPHPLSVLNPKKVHGALMPPALKEHLLAELGVGTLFVAKSEPELLELAAEDFVERFIMKGIRPSAIVEGEDFNFGHKRAGSVHTLQKLTKAKGIEVIIVDAKKAKLASGQTVEVSSTVIRDMVTKGKVADAAILLSRPYRLIGNIVPGRGKGKELGFPTLNLKKPQQIIPDEGVYAGLVEIGDSEAQVCSTKEKIPAAFSIGRATTYGAGQSLLIEAHLLTDNAGQYTGRYMTMDFIERIRSQQKFETGKELAEQIGRDCQKAQQILCNVVV
ncbi:MAG: bifunctional riboflavin kinase/FAD synthetase [Phycisphaerae bacterium]|nr:bifunctional riboflavin kinase/FAD synthetase [Phycisphaerae bacterium]MDD5381427.1 bifunctional riboflavin kinase/FAD synthetase [Phycisphaerae bacterium]